MYVTPAQLFFCALGLAFIFEGMIYFLFPSNLKRFLESISDIKVSTLRNFGLLAMVTGLFIVYLVLR
ncbi:hypothetical protein JCM13304A_12890 [Desulfothermus okinawensis JCM 13304]